MNDEQEYVADLCAYLYGARPRKVLPFQLNLPVSTTIKKRLFVISYVSDAGGYITLSCQGTNVNTLVGSTSGIDGLIYTMCDELSTSGANVVTGYECIY